MGSYGSSDERSAPRGKSKGVARFTPGPWEVERHDQDDGSIEYEIWNHSAEHYTRIATVSDKNDDANARCNAHVMAAAPELYAAILNSDDAHWTPAMRAALAKARGETK